MLDKLKSRKFLMAVASVIVGILTMLGLPDNFIALVSGAALVIIPVITYIATEGRIDAAAVNLTTDAVKEIMALIEAYKTEASIISTEKTTSTETTASAIAAETKQVTATLKGLIRANAK